MPTQRVATRCAAVSRRARRPQLRPRCLARVLNTCVPHMQGDNEFMTEAAYSVLIQHPNLLPVLGIGA